MREWVELPDALRPDARRLATELRRLKDHSGLSLTALAGQTSYSKSSWERYFNGKALPPRQAVLALGELVGAEPARLTAL
ncbi:helix-turn-helix domain-containing protein [Streptomyces mirabilis]